jgi:hypothetical protein
MILDDFCLLPVWFCYVIINVRNLENHMHIANRCAPWKIAKGAKNPILQSQSQRQSCITTDSQSASPSWCQAPIWDPWPIFLSPWNFL